MILVLKCCLVVSFSLCLWNGFASLIVREAKISLISNKSHGLKYHSRALSQKVTKNNIFEEYFKNIHSHEMGFFFYVEQGASGGQIC